MPRRDQGMGPGHQGPRVVLSYGQDSGVGRTLVSPVDSRSGGGGARDKLCPECLLHSSHGHLGVSGDEDPGREGGAVEG